MKRRHFFILILCFLALLTQSQTAAPSGILQITGEAGVQIFLDGDLKGTTNSEQQGLVIPNVPVGAHTLKAVKPGAPAKGLNLSLNPGEVKVLPLGPFGGSGPAPASAAGGRTSLAVYPVKAAGADSSLATAMTALLAAKLTSSTKLQVIEEAMLKTVMDRQGLNASDACDDSSCQVEIGKLVKAQKLVTGDLSKFGPKYILSLKVVDIQTGVNDFNTEVKSTCSEDKLDQLVEVAAAKIRNNFGEGIPVPLLPDEAPPPQAAGRNPYASGKGKISYPLPPAPPQSSAAEFSVPADQGTVYVYNPASALSGSGGLGMLMSSPTQDIPLVLQYDEAQTFGMVKTGACIKGGIPAGPHTWFDPYKKKPVLPFQAVAGGRHYFVAKLKIGMTASLNITEVSEAEAAAWASRCVPYNQAQQMQDMLRHR